MLLFILRLFTGGPDKGDLASLGLDTDAYPDLLFVEGADNAAPGALFKVPWNPKKGYWKYNADEESMQYNGINCWDYDGGAPEAQADVQALYERVWMPRYNFVYQCSHNLTYWPGTVEDLNSQENLMRYKDADVEFWVDGGDVYYYEAAEAKFIPSDIGEGTINLFGQLVDKGYGLTSAIVSGKSNAELNELFRAARVMKFSLEAPAKFNKRASIFSRNWMEFYAGSDNRTKNTYFIMLGEESDGYLCSLFWDDTDTIGPWTNQGQDKKGYWVEVGDKYDNGQPVWNGEQNRFYNLIEMAWAEDIRVEMHAMMTAMITLSGSETGNSSDRLYAFFHKYYFAKAQEYFPEVLYNAAARVMYEDAKLAYIEGTYTNDTDPITQSMGNYYSGWKRWIKYRIQYMQSKYAFGDYAATGGDSIVVRASGNDITYDITPAIWMYPCVANGTSIVRGERTKAGEVCQITVSLGGSADQQNHIKGAHYLQSIGGWWNKNVTGAMIVVGRMLRELRIGHETEDIVISIDTLTVKDTPSLQLLDVRRVATLAGVLDLSACTHLRYAYAGGTSVTQIALPGGGPLQYIEYSSLNQYLILRNFPLLKSEGVVITECLPVISDFLIENCSGLNPIDLLRSILAAQASQTVHSLKRVRAVGFNETYDTDGSAVLDDLAKLADGSYVGLDSSGLAGSDPYPVLDGELTINTFCYEDSVLALRQIFTRLTINISGGFYLRFADPEVLRILMSKGVGDGIGITTEAASKVTDIQNWFTKNTAITSFNELQKFSSLVQIGSFSTQNTYRDGFNSCENLESIVLTEYVETIGHFAFGNCYKLSMDLPQSIKSLGAGSFSRMGRDTENGFILNLPNLEKITSRTVSGINATYYTFMNSGVTRIESLGKITELLGQGYIESGEAYAMFSLCNKLTYANLSQISKIGIYTFYKCPVLSEVILSNSGVSVENYAFTYDTSLTKINTESLLSVGKRAFQETNIKTLNSPILASIGAGAFMYSGLEEVINLGNVEVLPTVSESVNGATRNCGVFYECGNLSKIVFPNCLRDIGGYAFYNCTSLEIEDLQLPNLETLGQNAFYGVKVKKISNLGKITALPTAAWNSQNYGDKSVLEEVVLPDTLTAIATESFYNYIKLKTVVIPNSVTSIGNYAFNGCSELQKVSIPDSVITFGTHSFRNCTGLTEISIGDGIETISGYSFYNCSNASKVIIGKNVKSINAEAFYNCSMISDINSPNSLETIGNAAFMNCFNNAENDIYIILPNVTTLNKSCFTNTKVDRIILPNASGSLSYTFNQSTTKLILLGADVTALSGEVMTNCKNLHHVIMLSETPPSYSGANFYANPSDMQLYVPDASVTAYREASGWSSYATKIKPISQLATDNPSLYEEVAEYL